MMQWMGAEALQYLQMMGGGMGIPASGTNIPASGTDGLANYLAASKQYANETGSAGLPSTNFYLVLAFPQGNYADKMDVHPEYPMLVPVSGTTPNILGIFPEEKDATAKMDADTQNVHLMYNLRLRGHQGIRDFLEFCASHDMIVPISGR